MADTSGPDEDARDRDPTTAGGGVGGPDPLTALQHRCAELAAQNRALEAAYQRYLDLYDRAPVGLLTLDRQGHIVEVNRTAAVLLDAHRERLEGSPLAAYLDENQRDLLQAHVARVFGGEAPADPTRVELRLAAPADSPQRLCVMLEGRASGDAAGAPRCRGVMIDVTRQRHAEDEVQRREAQYRSAIEAASDGFWMLDTEGRIIEVNEAYVRRSGYRRDELRGMWIGDLEARQTPAQIRACLARVRRHRGERFETQHRGKDGTLWPVEVSAAFSTSAGGLYFVFSRDISERRRLEHEILQASTTEQERIGREIHDGIGQELTGLAMMTEALKRQLTERGLAEEAAAAAGLHDYLETALGHARLLAHGLSPVEVDPHGLADALVKLAEWVEKTAGVECRYHGLRSLPLRDETTALHLYRIAQEAVQNALRHAHPRRITIALSEGRGRLVLEVSDDGRGIAALGERGTGLGLHLIQYRASIMGGHCDVWPAAGRGTRVRCEVPMDAAGAD